MVDDLENQIEAVAEGDETEETRIVSAGGDDYQNESSNEEIKNLKERISNSEKVSNELLVRLLEMENKFKIMEEENKETKKHVKKLEHKLYTAIGVDSVAKHSENKDVINVEEVRNKKNHSTETSSDGKDHSEDSNEKIDG